MSNVGFGERLRAAREGANLTKVQLCRLLDQAGYPTNRATYAAWEKIGTSTEFKIRSYPHPDIFSILANLFKVDARWLVFGDCGCAPKTNDVDGQLLSAIFLLPVVKKKVLVEVAKCMR